MQAQEIIDSLRGGLIVSCQAMPEEPLFGAGHMAAMACAAVSSGAVAIRANSPVDIVAIRKAVDVPIIGLFKQNLSGFDVYITPTLDYAMRVADAGADLVAVDATRRPHPEQNLKDLIGAIHMKTGLPVLADVSVLEEGVAAADLGADLIATSLSGYTSYSPVQDGPDFALVENLVKALSAQHIKVIAEGRIATPEEAVRALALGAHAVVVGSAITRPQWISARFIDAIRQGRAA